MDFRCSLKLVFSLVLVRNAGPGSLFCRTVSLEVRSIGFTRLPKSLQKGETLRLPVAHGEGCYIADASTPQRT